MIKMVDDVIKVEDDKWADYYALMVQELWKKEIDEAIGKVKGNIPKRNHKGYRKWRKRGYWTPAGFLWFRRKRKWGNHKRRA